MISDNTQAKAISDVGTHTAVSGGMRLIKGRIARISDKIRKILLKEALSPWTSSPENNSCLETVHPFFTYSATSNRERFFKGEKGKKQ